MNLDADANGSPYALSLPLRPRVFVCWIVIANGGVRNLKTGSLCRLIACISQVFQGRDTIDNPNGKNSLILVMMLPAVLSVPQQRDQVL